MLSTHPYPQTSCRLYPLLLHILSCMIYTLHRNMSKRKLHKMSYSRVFTGSGTTSAPPFWSTLIYNINLSLEFRSLGCMDTYFAIPTTSIVTWNDLVNSRFLRHGFKSWQPTFWMASLIRENPRRTVPYQNVQRS